MPPTDDFEWLPYVRISDDREGGGLGVARQLKDLHALAATLGGQVAEPLVDNDLTAFHGPYGSARYRPRPAYDQLCALLRERPGRRGVLAWHTDRLHRTPRQLEDFIDLIETTGAPVHTFKAGVIDLSHASGRMTARVHCAVAHHESEHKSERVLAKAKELATNGKIGNGGTRPFGYRRVFAGQGSHRRIVRDELHPAEAPIVRELAERVIAGEPFRTILIDLRDRDIRTSTGRHWTGAGLRLMLRSGRIAGLRTHHGQVTARAVWPAIITVEQHQQLRVILDARTSSTSPRRHYLSGFVFGCCPVRMKVSKVSGGYYRYTCPDRSEGGCKGRSIGLVGLEDLVDRYLVARLGDPRIRAEIAARERSQDAACAELAAKIEADERRLALLRDTLEDGEEDEIPEAMATIRHLRQRIAQARSALDRRSPVPAAVSDAVAVTLEEFLRFPLHTKRVILGFFVRRIAVGPGRVGTNRFDPGRVDIIPVGPSRS